MRGIGASVHSGDLEGALRIFKARVRTDGCLKYLKDIQSIANKTDRRRAKDRVAEARRRRHESRKRKNEEQYQ